MLTSRSGSQGHPAPPPPQSIEAVRRRARHRLIGAAVMVLVGVLGFPLLFDTQPRPIAVDIPIEIPSRNPVPSAAKPGAAVTADAGSLSTGSVTAAESLSTREEVVDARPAERAAVVEPPSAAPPEPPQAESRPAAAAPKPAAKPEVKPPVKVAEKAPDPVAAKEVKPPASGNERIVVQVGAFAEVQRAREARLKLERAGLKTYTHVAETPQGRRIRVRMGPFPTRAEAEKAAARAKALGLPAALLWL
jgi:DedD protein